MPYATLSFTEGPAHPLAIAERQTSRPLILLVDDDARLRRLIRAVIAYASACAQMDVDVLEAANYEAGWIIGNDADQRVDLLISDIHLGDGRSGIDLACDLSAQSPGLHVLLMSGSDLPGRAIPADWRFLSKPFRVADLVEQVNTLCAHNIA